MKGSFPKGILYMLLSAMSLSLVALFAKIGLKDLPVISLIFYRFVTSLVVSLIFLWFSGNLDKILPIRNVRLHLLRAFFVLVAQYSIFYYLENNSVLNATVLLNTGPLFIPLIEWAIMRQKVGKSTWIAVFVSFIGVLFILQPQKGIFIPSSLIGLLAGVSQAASQILLASGKERTDVTIFTLFALCSLFSFIPYLFFGTAHISSPIASLWSLGFMIILLALASTANQLFRGAAYQYGKPSNLATFLYASVIFSAAIDWLIFHHIPNTLSLIGGFLVIFGGILKIILRHFILKRRSQ